MPNTGRKRYEESDVNPNSPTYGQVRLGPWVVDETACPPATRYYSAEVSGYVSRNNCPSGQATTPVLYVVPQGAFVSYSSQPDADYQAQQHFQATKQDYANQNGLCGTRSVSVTSTAQLPKSVQFTLTRTVTTGDLQVVVEAQVETNTGTQQNTLTVTIPDGQSQVTGTIGFGGASVLTVNYCLIQSTDPSTYTF